jgi:hypothetical protein
MYFDSTPKEENLMILNVSPSLLFKGAQYTNRREQVLLSIDHEDIVD